LKEGLLLFAYVYLDCQAFSHIEFIEAKILGCSKDPDEIENELLGLLSIE
jgi:hypothetical protein